MEAMPDLGVELWLVFVVIGKRAVDLCQRQMRMLKVNLLRAPTICHLIQNNFRDLYFCAGNPCHILTIKFDLRGEDGRDWSPLASSIRCQNRRPISRCHLFLCERPMLMRRWMPFRIYTKGCQTPSS